MRLVYPDWKYKLQMYLGREIESGSETEYIWRLYDLRFTPENAAACLRKVLAGPEVPNGRSVV